MHFRWILSLCLGLAIASARAGAQSSKPVIIEEEMEAKFDFRCTVKRKDAAKSLTPASLLLGYKSRAPHIALTLSSNALKLSKVINGKTTTLATVQQFYVPPTPQGVPLILQWREGRLNVIYDGRTLLRQAGLGALSGAIAVTPGVNLEFAEARTQPIEPVSFADDFMRASGDKGQWDTVNGNWKVHSAADPAKVANAFTYIAQGKPAIAVAGNWFWDDYTAATAVRTAGGGELGLIVYWQDAKNYILYRWLAEDDDSARGKEKQLWRVWRGQPVMIAAAPGGYRARQWYHLAISAGNGLVNVIVDGQSVLQKRTDLFGQGKVGLYSSGAKETIFDDVTVDHALSVERLMALRCEAITPQFSKEQSMENWASPKAEWLAASKADQPSFWHRGAFFGDHTFELKATKLEPNRAKVTAVLGGDGESLTSGYALVLTQAGDKERVEAVLSRQGKAVSQARSVKIKPDEGCDVRLERRGHTIRGYVGKELVATYADNNPLPGRRDGYTVQGAQVQFSDARVTSSNLYDYTFYRAPTDWFVSGGTWDMTSRWDCTPTWSWYGGWSDRVAAIWNKHSFSGDYVVEVFAACKREAGSYRPRDMNISIAGNGRDLASGYSFIFGGWNNTATRIMRGTKQVAETKEMLLPKDYQGQAHHKWFCLRVEKIGDTISFYVDRKLALQYKDPAPLTGRRIALWTCGNGVMIARTTIYYEKELNTEPVPLLIEKDGLRTVQTDKLRWTVRGNDPGLRLDAVTADDVAPKAKTPQLPIVRAVNLEGGGQFAIVPELEAFDVLKTPKISFDCQLGKGTEVNLYVKAKGVYHSVRLTGPTKETEAESVKLIGALNTMRADGQWRHVNLDLAALLKPLYPNDGEIRVEEVFLGNMTRDTYGQAGFGANYPGTRYLVRSFSLLSANNLIAKSIEPQLKAGLSGTRVASTSLPLAPMPEPKPEEKKENVPASPATRGLFNLRVTYCQDADAGEFKQEMLNKPISWECFKERVFTKKMETIDCDWSDKSPGSGIRAKYWSARFVGKLMVPTEGEYVFYLDRLDDGGRLYIDGEAVIDSWLVQPSAEHASKTIRLTPGAHDIRLDFCQGTGLGSVTLRWNGPGFGKEVVPKTEKPEVTVPSRIAAGAR